MLFQYEGYHNAILFECHTCTRHNNNIPGLSLLESSYSTTYNVSNLLHRAGHDERMWKGIEEDDSTYGVRVYSGIGSGEHFAKSLTSALMQDDYMRSHPGNGIQFQAKL